MDYQRVLRIPAAPLSTVVYRIWQQRYTESGTTGLNGDKVMIDSGKEDWKVALDPLVYAKVKGIATVKGVTIEEWVNESLRNAVREAPEATEAILQAIRQAGECNAPVWIVEGMLQEFESWRRRE